MVLPTRPLPKLTALFSLALAINRLNELEPLASALYGEDYGDFVQKLQESGEIIKSIDLDIRRTLAMIEQAPDIMTPDNRLIRPSLVRLHFDLSTGQIVSLNCTVWKLEELRMESTSVLEYLEHLSGLALAGEAEEDDDCMEDDDKHKRLMLMQKVARYIAALQTTLRKFRVRLVPTDVVSAADMTAECADQSFFNSLFDKLAPEYLWPGYFKHT